MAVQIKLEFPEEVFSALRSNPDVFAKEMRLAAAVKWYEVGLISQSNRRVALHQILARSRL